MEVLALFGPVGLPEMLIILAIVILIFGANRLPELGRGIGSGIKNFKSSIKDILASPYEKDRVTVPVGVAEDSKPFMGDNFKTTLRDLESRMRQAAH